MNDFLKVGSILGIVVFILSLVLGNSVIYVLSVLAIIGIIAIYLDKDTVAIPIYIVAIFGLFFVIAAPVAIILSAFTTGFSSIWLFIVFVICGFTIGYKNIITLKT